MTDQKLVSVIVPVYNSESYVGGVVQSFLRQSYQNFELILIDDGSTDDSLTVLRNLQRENQETIYVYTQSNQGVAKTRNRGILEARGYYVMFADNDDFVEPDYIEQMVNEIERKHADMVICSCRKVDEKGKTLYEQVLTNDDWAKFRMVAPWARIIRKEFVIENRIEFGDFKVGEDSYFTVTAYNLSDKIVTLPYIGYNWVQRSSSVSNTIQKTELADPIPFLEALIERNRELIYISQDMFEYFIIKFIVWHLYYVCDTLDIKTLKQCCKQCFCWLNKARPAYRENPLLSFRTPRGEDLKICVLVMLLTRSAAPIRFFMLRMLRVAKRYIAMR